MDVCRICLANRTDKDIFQPQANNGKVKNYADMILFCLNIQVVEPSKMSKKLCIKCYRKVVAFYKFKTLALKNDAYLRSLEQETEVKDEVQPTDDIKAERLSVSDVSEAGEIQDGLLLKAEEAQAFETDDELLSVIKKIKYEYVEDNTKEIGPMKNKNKTRRKKKKPTSNTLSESEKQMCSECGITVRDLKTHMLSHIPMEARKRIPCRSCDKTFTSQSARYKHNKIKHLGIKQKCNICNKMVTYAKQHYRTVHNPASLPYECVLCGRRFISKSVLDIHLTSHTKDRPFDCVLCGNKYPSKTLLLMHKRRVHDKEKTHLCQLCSKSFFKKYQLQVHLRSHSKEKPYACPECGKCFSTTTTLRSHRLIHGETKSYACTLCDMTFAKRGYLNAHMISHTKEKRHPCQYCGVKFGRSDHRKRHERTAHEKHLVTST